MTRYMITKGGCIAPATVDSSTDRASLTSLRRHGWRAEWITTREATRWRRLVLTSPEPVRSATEFLAATIVKR